MLTTNTDTVGLVDWQADKTFPVVLVPLEPQVPSGQCLSVPVSFLSTKHQQLNQEKGKALFNGLLIGPIMCF